MSQIVFKILTFNKWTRKLAENYKKRAIIYTFLRVSIQGISHRMLIQTDMLTKTIKLLE